MTKSLDFNPQFRRALELMKENKKSLFITGKAGTGKSTLLEYFRSHTDKKPVLLAPTGVSALNIKGQTIHSFFKFYVDITPEKILKKKSVKNAATYKKLTALIIDEVSMVRADLLDCVDVFLRRFGPKAGRPFGGVQMIFVGDLCQLPPVVTSAERAIFSSHYKTPFFFSAKVFENFDVETIELEKIYRQKDQKFIDLLNRIRNNSVKSGDMDCLNSRYKPSFQPEKGDFYITLTSRNRAADHINEERLKTLKSRTYSSNAFIEGEFGKEYFPTSRDLQFKIGAQIMLLNNDQKKRWVNGSIGVITAVSGDQEYVRVRLYPEDKTVSVYQHTWEIYRFSFSEKKQAVVSERAGAFVQFPFRLAWAVTIHKSQGKTFDRVIIDTSQGMFVGGQAYVALSRCTSFEGIVLKVPFKRHHIQIDRRVFDFLTEQQYKEAERQQTLADKIKILRRALDQKHKLTMTYLKADNTKSRRTVTPLEVGERTYSGKTFQGMKAFCLQAGEERVFRVDRILRLEDSVP